METESEAKVRIEKDIALFKESVKSVEGKTETARVVELAKMYASDAQSFLDDNKLYTAFASINYAHGLIDALKELAKK